MTETDAERTERIAKFVARNFAWREGHTFFNILSPEMTRDQAAAQAQSDSDFILTQARILKEQAETLSRFEPSETEARRRRVRMFAVALLRAPEFMKAWGAGDDVVQTAIDIDNRINERIKGP